MELRFYTKYHPTLKDKLKYYPEGIYRISLNSDDIDNPEDKMCSSREEARIYLSLMDLKVGRLKNRWMNFCFVFELEKVQ